MLEEWIYFVNVMKVFDIVLEGYSHTQDPKSQQAHLNFFYEFAETGVLRHKVMNVVELEMCNKCN